MAAFCFIPIEVGWALCYIPVALGVNMLLPWGAVAEWLRRGLQILVPRFKSGPRLQLLKDFCRLAKNLRIFTTADLFVGLPQFLTILWIAPSVVINGFSDQLLTALAINFIERSPANFV